MVYPNEVLAQSILKSSFYLSVHTPQEGGGETQNIYKISKKQFFKEVDAIDSSFNAKFVKECPPSDMEPNVFYIKENGKIVWVKRV